MFLAVLRCRCPVWKSRRGTGGFCLVIGGAVIAAGVVAVGFLIAVSGSELGGGEGDPGEHLAGILGAAARILTAFFGGDGVIHYRDYQLGIPFQTNDGELAQGDEEPPPVAGEDQFLVEQAGDPVGDVDGFLAGAVADFLDLGAEDHGVQYLHCGHQFAMQIYVAAMVSSFFSTTRTVPSLFTEI